VIAQVNKQRTCSEDVNRHHLDHAFTDRQFGPAPEAWEPRPLRVLVIEDDADTADSLSRLVKLWGHDVHQATTAKAGVDLALTYHPDFVLLDIAMPGMDGCAVAQRLHSDPHLQGCCIGAMTGSGDAEQQQRCAEAGIDQFLVKPVDLDTLESVLNLRCAEAR